MRLVAATTDVATRIDPEIQARIDLAAAHRIAEMQGLSEGIFNHLTLAVPGRKDRYYQIPFGLHWSEVTASSLMEVGYDGTLLKGSGDIERSCYCIHAPIHELIPTAACVMHTHMPFASAICRLAEPRIEAIGQTEISFLDRIAYDDAYSGLAWDPAEGRRLAGLLGDKTVMLLANHGPLVVGRTVAEAYDRLYYLERACQVQLYAMSSGRPLKALAPEVVEHTRRQFRSPPRFTEKSTCEVHFDALKRILDRRGDNYRD
jgi:ribulose-5-phosphate 4-epimerase/fuculose-1-phosphate aldolase